MSFILDALKKSENERQRQIGPSLGDVQIRRARADRPWWAVAVGALLVVNLGVLLVVLMRDRNAPAEAPASVASTPIAEAQAPITARPTPQQNAGAPMTELPRRTEAAAPALVHTSPAVQSLAEAAGAGIESEMQEEAPYDPSIASAAVVPDGPPVVRSITPPTVAPLPDQATFAARNRAGNAAQNEMLPTHNSLIADGANLPDMKLDIHVYSPMPKDRFVFVNMRKYVEGQALTEGPLLERITADGAIMNYNGTRFLLPRQ